MQGDIFHAHDPYIQYYGLYDKDQVIILYTAKTNLFHQYFTFVLTLPLLDSLLIICGSS